MPCKFFIFDHGHKATLVNTIGHAAEIDSSEAAVPHNLLNIPPFDVADEHVAEIIHFLGPAPIDYYLGAIHGADHRLAPRHHGPIYFEEFPALVLRLHIEALD
uniref:Uncharacterized protein n=1 Tax=Favella ehrenbergii TaxID=182087 RepID=A0A7S3I082_9SPIT|mmetsp:Transcript_24971/g.31165  ORF Transcript_24971/g.31165 Transcript_24971/m.31165 type:complete len:103 (+) Transcript_24971:165-473(+)